MPHQHMLQALSLNCKFLSFVSGATDKAVQPRHLLRGLGWGMSAPGVQDAAAVDTFREASSWGGCLEMLVCGPSSENASRPSFPWFPAGLRLIHALSQKPGILETRLFQMLWHMALDIFLATLEMEGFPGSCYGYWHARHSHVIWSVLSVQCHLIP